MRHLLFLFALLATTWVERDCQEFADRSAGIAAGGVTRVVIVGGAGSLRVDGRANAREIRAEGRACAPIEELLVGMRLSVSRSGSEVTVKASLPDQKGRAFASQPRLDFTVAVPATIAVDVADTSGDVLIHDVRSVRVAKSADGSVRVTDVRGDLSVLAKRGVKIDYERVGGRVSIRRR